MITNILQYLENSAGRFPDKTAFGDTRQQISYKELTARAKALGTALAGYGFRNQPIIAATNHSIECLVTFLGIVYSGNFYVPVDVKLPAARIRAILEVANPCMVLVPQKDEEKFKEFADEDRLLIREGLDQGAIDEEILLNIRKTHLDTDPLYLMFTSGSTGMPKGVLICHRSVIDLAEQFADTFHFDEHEVFANQAPFDFDVSVKDIYCTLRNGASLFVVPQSMFSMPKALIPYLNDHKVTTIIWAVSALSILSAMKVLDKNKPLYLKKIMFSGEVMPMKVLNDWQSHLPDCMYVNLYGPTEITCNCTYYILDRKFSDRETLPIGQAFQNTEIMLLDENEHEVPSGETGEICVRGTCLAHGYYRNPEATRAAFRQNPQNQAYPEYIYHTGDYGRRNEKGELMFSARRDWQIKHMGHRIELAEIENAVNTFPWIERCCCQYDEKHSKIILIYQAAEPMDGQIVKGIQEYLPKYMCPNRLIWMKKMPVNQRGKTDRVFLKQKFLNLKNQILYKEAIVLGTGTLALQCAQVLAKREIHCIIYDTGETPSKTLMLQAQKKGITCCRYSKIELADELAAICAPTLVVSAINPWILPPKAVENPYLLIINCHQALLPEYPGRNAEMWAIYDQKERTGITWHIVSAQVDAGDILVQKEIALSAQSTSIGVFREQSKAAFETFEGILDELLKGTYMAKPQKGQRGKLHYSWESPQDGEIQLTDSFVKNSAFLRAHDYGGLTVTRRPWFKWQGGRYFYGGYHIYQDEKYEEIISDEPEIEFSQQANCMELKYRDGRIKLNKITSIAKEEA